MLPTPEGIGAAVAAADRRDPAFGVFVRLAAATGARRGELCALQWRAIDLDRACRLDRDVRRDYPGGGVLIKDTKNHSRRRVAIDAATIAAVREHRARVDERAGLAGVIVTGEGFVFSHEPDARQPWYVDNVSHNWDKVRREVGLDGVRLRDLRHLEATQLLQAGIAVPTLRCRSEGLRERKACHERCPRGSPRRRVTGTRGTGTSARGDGSRGNSRCLGARRPRATVPTRRPRRMPYRRNGGHGE